jgi:HSP20 family protein
MSRLSIKHAHDLLPVMSDSWRNLRQEMDKLFDRFADGFDSFSLEPVERLDRFLRQGGAGFAAVAVDVRENDKEYTVTAEIPGAAEKDIDVSVADGMLVIKGEKRGEKSGRNTITERSYGAFQRMFNLPRDADGNNIEARFENGVLTVHVPRKAVAAQPRKVDIKAA